MSTTTVPVHRRVKKLMNLCSNMQLSYFTPPIRVSNLCVFLAGIERTAERKFLHRSTLVQLALHSLDPQRRAKRRRSTTSFRDGDGSAYLSGLQPLQSVGPDQTFT